MCEDSVKNSLCVNSNNHQLNFILMNRLSYHLSFYSVLFFAFFSHGHRVVVRLQHPK